MAIKNPREQSLKQSFAFIIAVLWVCYGVYLYQTNGTSQYIVDTIGSFGVVYVPDFVLNLIGSKGWIQVGSTFAVHAIYAIAWAYLLYWLAPKLMNLILKPKSEIKPIQDERKIDPPKTTARMKLLSPSGNGWSDSDPFPVLGHYFGHAPIKLKRDPQNAIETLSRSLLSVLVAHKEWPACIKGHHADTSLYEHSLSVVKKLNELAVDKGIADPLLQTIGLAHDIEKIVAYRFKNERWVRVASHYHHVGSQLLSDLEGYGELDEGDKRALLWVIKYSHSPEDIPINATDRELMLLDLLRKADGLATAEEQRFISVKVAKSKMAISEKTDQTETDDGSNNSIMAVNNSTEGEINGIRLDDIEAVASVLYSIIENLDINRHRGGMQNEGWYLDGKPYFFVTNTMLLDRLTEVLPQPVCRRYQIGVNNKRGNHPALELVTQALTLSKLVVTNADGMEYPDGICTLKSGNFKFANTRIMPVSTMKTYKPSLIRSWGSTEYPITIIQQPSPIK